MGHSTRIGTALDGNGAPPREACTVGMPHSDFLDWQVSTATTSLVVCRQLIWMRVVAGRGELRTLPTLM